MFRKLGYQRKWKVASDCAVVACSEASGDSYETAFRKLGHDPADLVPLESLTGRWCDASTKWPAIVKAYAPGGKDSAFPADSRPTVAEFAAKHPRGTWALGVAYFDEIKNRDSGHCVVVRDGDVLDRADPSGCVVWQYFRFGRTGKAGGRTIGENERNDVKKNDFVFFWGTGPKSKVQKGCFSQWWPCRFEVDGVEYGSAEQFMMAGKARTFGDLDAEKAIMASSNQKEIKALGRGVRGFDPEVWKKAGYEIVKKGNYAKFSQNPDLKDFLLSTGDAVIAEASPKDFIWGIGLAEDDPRAADPAKWKGKNLLGKALMEVRDALRKGTELQESRIWNGPGDIRSIDTRDRVWTTATNYSRFEQEISPVNPLMASKRPERTLWYSYEKDDGWPSWVFFFRLKEQNACDLTDDADMSALGMSEGAAIFRKYGEPYFSLNGPGPVKDTFLQARPFVLAAEACKKAWCEAGGRGTSLADVFRGDGVAEPDAVMKRVAQQLSGDEAAYVRFFRQLRKAYVRNRSAVDSDWRIHQRRKQAKAEGANDGPYGTFIDFLQQILFTVVSRSVDVCYCRELGRERGKWSTGALKETAHPTIIVFNEKAIARRDGRKQVAGPISRSAFEHAVESVLQSEPNADTSSLIQHVAALLVGDEDISPDAVPPKIKKLTEYAVLCTDLDGKPVVVHRKSYRDDGLSARDEEKALAGVGPGGKFVGTFKLPDEQAELDAERARRKLTQYTILMLRNGQPVTVAVSAYSSDSLPEKVRNAAVEKQQIPGIPVILVGTFKMPDEQNELNAEIARLKAERERQTAAAEKEAANAEAMRKQAAQAADLEAAEHPFQTWLKQFRTDNEHTLKKKSEFKIGYAVQFENGRIYRDAANNDKIWYSKPYSALTPQEALCMYCQANSQVFDQGSPKKKTSKGGTPYFERIVKVEGSEGSMSPEEVDEFLSSLPGRASDFSYIKAGGDRIN